MKHVTVIANFVVLLLFFSCDEEKINRPAFQTNEVTELSDQGVTFNAKISVIGTSPIDDYGFVWATHPSPVLTDSVYYFGQKPQAGPFSIRVSDDLITGAQYFVRSFLKSSKEIYYSNAVEFKSQGSATPVIADFTPKSGYALKTITLTGDHFSKTVSNNSVKIGDLSLKILSASRNELVVQIPTAYTTGKYPISVTVAGKTGKSATNFVLEGPQIEGISPASGPAGTEITLSGYGFSATITANFVFFGDQKATVKSATTERLTVIVPENSSAGPKSVSVVLNNVKGICPLQFDLTGPTITSFSPAAGTQGSEVIIIGNGFSSNPNENMVSIGHHYAKVIAATPQQLNVIVPFVQSAGDVGIYVTVKSIMAAALNLFTIEGPEITSFAPTAQYGGREITIFGKNFEPGPNTYVTFFNIEATIINKTATSLTVQVPHDLTKSCPIELNIGSIKVKTTTDFTLLSPWEKQVNFAGGERYAAASFTVGSYAYIAMGRSSAGYRKDVWQFDPANNRWTRKADYPGPSRAYSFSFVINGKAYVGGGTLSTGARLYDLWEYDPTTDTWTQKSSYSPNGLSSVDFVATAIGSYGYFAANNRLYRYDPSANQWVTFNSYPWAHTNSRGIALTIGDKGYFGLGVSSHTFWEYTPATNTWTQLPDCPMSFWHGHPLSFVINNKIYLGSSANFYEFDPLTNQWKQMPVIPEGGGFSAAFSLNNIGYVATGLNGTPLNLSYKFNPNY